MNGRVRRHVLVLAYACGPDEGSEPGVGWAWTIAMSETDEITVVTRANNRPAIEEALGQSTRAGLNFVYLDLPPWARVWKRGQRGVRLYYFIWQLLALRSMRRIAREQHVDVVWHLTLANAWLGSVAPFVGPRCVLGPVGGGVGACWRLTARLGWRGLLYELARGFSRTAGKYLNPFVRMSWRRADLILAQNHETARWLGSLPAREPVVFPNGTCAMPPEAPHRDDRSSAPGERVAVFVGRLIGWKGGEIALRAVAGMPGWRLRIVGTGPEETRLRRLASRISAGGVVEFLGRVPHAEVFETLRAADVLLVPSLHEDCSFAAVEAVTLGVPVVYLNRGGPPLVVGTAGVPVNPRGSRTAVVNRLRETLVSLDWDSLDIAGQSERLMMSTRLPRLRELVLGERQ